MASVDASSCAVPQQAQQLTLPVILQLVFALLCIAGTAAAQRPAQPAPPQRFEKVLWCSDEAGHALARARGYTAVQLGRGGDAATVRARGLRFYLDQPIGKGLLELRDEQWRPVVQEFERTRDPAKLIRPTCFAEPGVVERAVAAAAAEARRVGPEAMLFVALADEASSTRHNAPLDTCRCEHCQRAFRVFLKQRFAELDDLNEALGTHFAKFEDVQPLSTDQVRRRELGDRLLPLDLRAFSLWLEFVDAQFADAVASIRKGVVEAVPGVPVGLTGLNVPGAFGGHDYARLCAGHTLAEAYAIGAAPELLRSVVPAGAHRYATLAPPSEQDLAGNVPLDGYVRAALADLACHGLAGVVVWNDRTIATPPGADDATQAPEVSETPIATPDGAREATENVGDVPPAEWPVTRFGRALERGFAALGPALDALAGARIVPGDVWLVDSQPSVRAWWMLDSAKDGMTWVRRLASYEAGHSTSQAARLGWSRLLQDLGLQPTFVSDAALPERLLNEQPRCVVLPATIALSERAAQALQIYVRSGGTVLADHSTGIYDEHLERRGAGVLDELFGVQERSLAWNDLLVREGASLAEPTGSAALPPVELGLRGELGERGSRADTFLERTHGRGRTVYMNATVVDYPEWRLQPRHILPARELRRRVRAALQRARVSPPCEVAGEFLPTCIERVPLELRDGRRVIAVRVHALDRASLLRQMAEAGPVEVELLFTRRVRLRDLDGRELGDGNRVGVRLDPFGATFVEVGR